MYAWSSRSKNPHYTCLCCTFVLEDEKGNPFSLDVLQAKLNNGTLRKLRCARNLIHETLEERRKYFAFDEYFVAWLLNPLFFEEVKGMMDPAPEDASGELVNDNELEARHLERRECLRKVLRIFHSRHLANGVLRSSFLQEDHDDNKNELDKLVLISMSAFDTYVITPVEAMKMKKYLVNDKEELRLWWTDGDHAVRPLKGIASTLLRASLVRLTASAATVKTSRFEPR